jgi:hypothetical protein
MEIVERGECWAVLFSARRGFEERGVEVVGGGGSGGGGVFEFVMSGRTVGWRRDVASG